MSISNILVPKPDRPHLLGGQRGILRLLALQPDQAAQVRHVQRLQGDHHKPAQN